MGMGVLPLEFADGQSRESLGLTGTETFTFGDLDDNLAPRQTLTVTATAPDGAAKSFAVMCRIDTPVEIEYYRNGGILQTVLRNMLKS